MLDRRYAAVLTAALTMALAGCTTASTSVPEALPEGATPVSAVPAAPPKETCDARQSLPADLTGYQRPTSGVLRVGVDQADATMSHWNPATRTFEGFNIDLIDQIVRSLWPGDDPTKHLRFVVVPPGAGGFGALLDNQIDIIATSLTATCDRARQVAFSDDTLDSGQSILVRKKDGAPEFDSLGALRGRRVCAAQQTTSLDNLLRAGQQLRVTQVSNVIDCLLMLEQDQVDAVSTDHNILLGFQAMTTDTVVPETPSHDTGSCAHHDSTPCPWFSDEAHAFAVRKGDTSLLRYVNAVLESPAGRQAWSDAHHTWLADHHDKGDPPADPLATTTWPY